MNNNVNPMQLISMIKNGKNPQQLMMGYLQNQLGGTPMGDNLLQLAQTGRTSDIEKIARNMAAARGLDFDKEFNAFKQQFGL